MDFIDNQAEESDASTDHSDDEREPQSKKMKMAKEKSKKKKVVASSDEDEDDDDDDEEGREEMKGFIADEDDEEDDAKSEKSEKSRHSGEDELDDEDLDLINENLDIRRDPKKNRVQLGDSSDEDEPIRKGGDTRDDDLLSERGSDDGARRKDRGGYGSESERSEDDFIEDDGDAPRRHRKRHRGDEHMPEGAEEDARDVFGVEDFNFDEFYDDEDAEDGMEDEEEEIIEDDGEGGEIKIRRKKDTSKKSTLLESIEPSELDRGFLSAADKKIMADDAPERFQLRRTPVTEADEDELEREAHWIMKHAFEEATITNQSSMDNYDKLECIMNLEPSMYEEKKKEVINSIKTVLQFIRVRSNSFEVSFIVTYRKEVIDNLLTVNNCWKVYDYDQKWCHLLEKQRKLHELMRRMRDYQEHSDDLTAKRRPITEMDLIEVNYTESLEQLTDFHANFQLLYGGLLEDMTKWEKERRQTEEEEHEFKVKFKSSIRNDKYRMCDENGIGELAARFGLTAKQIAENLDWRKHEVDQDPTLPITAAAEYICPAFPDAETVIEGAKFMLAKEISRQPLVRHRVRQDFRSSARFWVRLTKKGLETVDETHPIFERRYIKNKPIRSLSDEEFLYYHKAKEDGLIDLFISYESEEEQAQNHFLYKKFIDDGIFRRDEYSDNVEQWNALRDDVIQKAIDEMLVPYIKDEVYNSILEEAKTAVAKKCRKEFAARIARSGFQPEIDENRDDDDDDLDPHGARRIMAVCYTTDRDEASFGVMVDENGAIVDYLRMVHFTKRGFGGGNFAILKKESMDLFKKFVQRRRPQAIGLNIQDMDCLRLKRDLEEAINELVVNRIIYRSVPVFLMDSEAAKVYMRSNLATSENPDHPPILRQAVSLARLLLDPIPEYAHLWNSDEDIFCLSLHPLQRDIEQEVLAEVLNHELVNKVNEEGVDVNKCAEFPHYTNMLQFVCGLGPRKATSLLKSIKANDNLIESRSKLVVGCKLGPKVFMNCAGFIRIDTHKVSEKTDAYVEVLDGSRVHPETYEWARKMAVDALEVDDSADPTAALQEIMESPDRLRDLDLDAFADELSRQGFGEKKSTLYDIASELSGRYKDLREPFQEPSGEELYELLARCGKEVKEGAKVLGTVQSVQYRKVDKDSVATSLPDMGEDGLFACAFCKAFKSTEPDDVRIHTSTDHRQGGCPGTPVGIRVRFDNGMTGFCPNKNISSSHVENPLHRVKLGQPYYFKVLKVDKEKFSLFLSCKSSDLKDEDASQRDEYWDAQTYEDDQEVLRNEAKKKKESSTRVKRVIAHPNFHNVSYEAATKMLDELDWSECIIRPSANKDSGLSVTWKICNRVYHNFFVKESAKDQIFSIGRQLSVGGEDFEDLDELIARFVQPMIQMSHEITTHKYFFPMGTCEDTDAVENFVREKKRELGRSPYVFSASFRQPCQFCISYMFDNTERIRHEYLKIAPRGIRFRHQNFDTLDHMLAWFKRHYHEAPIEMRSAAPPTSSQYRAPPPQGHYFPPQFVGYH